MLSKTEKDIKIREREVYRYLGFGGNKPEEGLAEMIRSCTEDVLECSELRYIAERFPLRLSENGGELIIADMEIMSNDLAKNLEGCREVYLMGATIGVGVDRLIARASVSDMSKAAIYQAVGAAYIEEYCDYINDGIKAIACREGLETRPRFSPGYGDLSLEMQKDIASLLKLSKHVGISLSDGMLMSPSKSVTAIIGLKPAEAADGEPGGGSGQDEKIEAGGKCSMCDMEGCKYKDVSAEK